MGPHGIVKLGRFGVAASGASEGERALTSGYGAARANGLRMPTCCSWLATCCRLSSVAISGSPARRRARITVCGCQLASDRVAPCCMLSWVAIFREDDRAPSEEVESFAFAELEDGLPLGLQAQAGAALPVCRDTDAGYDWDRHSETLVCCDGRGRKGQRRALDDGPDQRCDAVCVVAAPAVPFAGRKTPRRARSVVT